MDTPATPDPDRPVSPRPGPNGPPPEPRSPQAGPPGDADEAPTSIAAWLARNAGTLVVTALVLGYLFYSFDAYTIFKVAVGLGLVIFIHELGHFLAAKWCDVHVETFSIGFGPAIPGCRFKYGETTYMLGLIPLGGYVKMVGEGETGSDEEGEEDPRSFKNKSVGQRMLIISAGVIMNVFLACVCFVVAYLHGVEEIPAIIGAVNTGSPAWQQGLHSGEVIQQIGNKNRPAFNDIRPIVMNTDEGEKLRIRVAPVDNPNAGTETYVEPGVDKDSLVPMIGVAPALKPEVRSSRRPGFQPFVGDSAASKAEPPFEQGDTIVGMTDPDRPDTVTPLENDPNRPAVEYFDYYRRLVRLEGKPIVVQVRRAGAKPDAAPVDVRVPPAYHRALGMRMQMGRVVAVRHDSPATRARPVDPANAQPGILPPDPASKSQGDKLIEVEVTQRDGTKLRFVAAPGKEPPKGVKEVVLDPLRLPYELNRWAGDNPKDLKVRLTVLRSQEHKTNDRVTLETEWDPNWRFAREMLSTPNSPMSIAGLGLAYRVDTTVDAVAPGSPAAEAGLKANDVVKKVRVTFREKGKNKLSSWVELKPDQWAFVAGWLLQYADGPEVGLQVQRGESETFEATLNAVEDTNWPMAERGLALDNDTRLQQADGIGEALAMGGWRTVRTITLIYQNLRAMFVGRVSPWSLSGPITIASVSYDIAHESLYAFILFIGMININLAVINFLPIPVLDGGHMVFLMYEWLRGKPPPEKFQIGAMLVGLALILSLMCFVLFLDIRRLFF